MKATIETDRRSVVISWTVAGIIALSGFLAINLMPKPDNKALTLPSKPKAERVKKKDKLKKKRVLPEEHLDKMILSSEVLVKKELRQRLKLFKEIAQSVSKREQNLLAQVEKRPTPAGAPPEINDTRVAQGSPHRELPPLSPNASVEDFYDRLAEYEDGILQDHLEGVAAKKALEQGLSYPDTLAAMKSSATRMPGYVDLIKTVNEQHGVEGDTLPAIRTVEDINKYRDLLAQTTRQSGLAESRLLGLVTEVGRQPPPPPPPGGDGGTQDGEGGMATDLVSKMPTRPYELHEAKFKSEQLVAAQALPGRRYSRKSKRTGWLYVNTWYMIGPWDGYGRNDFTLTHQPEQGIDLDAVYRDGQKGKGIAETDSHPMKIQGEEVELDGILRWKFMQSESMHNVMPVTTDGSTSYAYTELYFDEAAKMLVALGTDDSGKLWINGKKVWQDEGWSWYHIDEHLEEITFRRGWNRILVRVDNNGGAAGGFSFLICPPDAALVPKKK